MDIERSPSKKRNELNEEERLGNVALDYEKQLSLKRQERAEARRLRLSELEKEQRELDPNTDDNASISSYNSSLTTHADFGIRSRKSEKDLKNTVQDLDAQLKQKKIENEQLEREKEVLLYHDSKQRDLIEDYESRLSSLKREIKKKKSENEAQRKQLDAASRKIDNYKLILAQRDELIKQHGFIGIPDSSGDTGGLKALLSQQAANALSASSSEDLPASIDAQILRIASERDNLFKECQQLHEKLSSTETPKQSKYEKLENVLTDPLVELKISEIQRDCQRTVAEYKLKFQKSDQDLQQANATCNRLEGQVQRFKQAAEHHEAQEDQLKAERRKLVRENRNFQDKIEDLEQTRDHLEKRLEKMRISHRERFNITD